MEVNGISPFKKENDQKCFTINKNVCMYVLNEY